jgi:hypothetical protein
MSKIIISKLHLKDLNKFNVFIKKHWVSKINLSNLKKVFKWQYQNNKYYNFYVARKLKKIIGIQGYIPINHYDKSFNKDQIFLAFLRVMEGKHIGVGLKLQQNIIKENNHKFIGVVNIVKLTHNFHKWLGFTIHKMNHHFIFSQKINKFKILKLRKLRKLKIKKQLNTSVIELNSKNINKLLNNSFYNIQIPTKSNKFIINRYIKHPFYKYVVLLISKHKVPKAIMVIRPIKIKNTTVLRFVDYIGSEKSFLLTSIISSKLLEKFNAEYIDLYSYGISKKILKNAGYTNRYNEKDSIVPNHFEPFEKKNIDLFCGFKSKLDNSKIKLFKGDGDGDRPSILKSSKLI